MRALSIMQPWAWLIVAGHKDIENRTRATGVRGRILVHAGKRVDLDAMTEIKAGRHPVTGRPLRLTLPGAFPTGAVVGEVEIVMCVTDHRSDWFVGDHGFVLRNPLEFAPEPWRGQLGFFDIPDDTARRLVPLTPASAGQGRLI
ncbi:ASCH domain-containing protein [Methylobrevis pamukkalensis]|uniref:ASCH domain protein n=1 Tax=Methylobrevis pamukkalensis TaxID=1439726 RepID=A0A1E3GZ66_9HYPH|nr:ASCH domain-containing protein [Methylobrevis pamukkalensis]ODN69225.1 ASCH domain protein [Methylobrevis pamukkalensis]